MVQTPSDKEKNMKHILSTLALTTTLLVGGTASAKTIIPQPAANSKILATFYDGNPSDGGTLVESDFQVVLTDSTIGKSINDVEDANYIKLDVDDISLVFEVPGPMSTTVSLQGVNNDADFNLGEVTNAIQQALAGNANLAIFTDDDGIVRGFYAFAPGESTRLDVADASQLLLFSSQTAVTYNVLSPGTRDLDNVQVDSGNGNYVSLFNLALSENLM
jgi:hypothetical protein